MSAMTICNLSEEVHLALKHRARQHGKSTEAEVRAILKEAVRPKQQVGLGTALAELGRKYGPLEFVRDPRPAEPVNFD